MVCIANVGHRGRTKWDEYVINATSEIGLTAEWRQVLSQVRGNLFNGEEDNLTVQFTYCDELGAVGGTWVQPVRAFDMCDNYFLYAVAAIRSNYIVNSWRSEKVIQPLKRLSMRKRATSKIRISDFVGFAHTKVSPRALREAYGKGIFIVSCEDISMYYIVTKEIYDLAT